MKILLSLLLTCIFTNFTTHKNSIEGLDVKFRKVTEAYIITRTYPIAGSLSVTPDKGFKYVKLKLTLKNTGNNECNLELADTYISTEKDSLYPFYCLEGTMTNTKTRIKPSKEVNRNVYFVFPEHAKPIELFIEDRRFKIEVVEE